MKQKRDRKQQRLDQEQHYAGLVENKPPESAVEEFNRKAYSVDEYAKNRGIDTRRMIAGG